MANYGRKVIKNDDGLIDKKTGELIGEFGYFKNEEQIKKQREYFERLNKIKLEKKERNEKYEKIENPFIWAYFLEQKILFPDLRSQDIARLFFIATYCEFKTNALIDNKTYLTKENIFDLVKISRTQFKEWYKKMINLEYLYEKNGKIILNKKFFNRGELVNDNNATRLFIDITQNLYKNIEPKDHYKIGYILKLIPYINFNFNVLSKNPKETDREKIQRFQMDDLAEILGVDKKNIKRLANELLSLSFGEKKTPLIGLVAFRSLDVNKMLIILNSKLIFGGNLDQYKQIEEIFDTRLLNSNIENYFDKEFN